MWRRREENGNINNKIVKHAVGIDFGQNVQLLSQSHISKKLPELMLSSNVHPPTTPQLFNINIKVKGPSPIVNLNLQCQNSTPPIPNHTKEEE